MTAIVWFRSDLRLGDNPAWAAATAEHDRVIPLFVLDRRLWGSGTGRRSVQLAHHLVALDRDLQGRFSGRLRVVVGAPSHVVPAIAAEADAVYWNDGYSPYAVERDTIVASALGDAARRYHGGVVHPPNRLSTKAGTPYTVFTPYHRAWAAAAWKEWPVAGSAEITGEAGDGLPEPDGAPTMDPGEAAALHRLESFLDRVDRYEEERNRPDLDATSHLSADLKFGTLAARTVASEVGSGTPGRDGFVRQLCWRDFYAQIMFHHPATLNQALKDKYRNIAWRSDPEGLAAWGRGMTGYPIVDAGMRQLHAEGWMHNRVRMITASFLVKDLLVDWRIGERFFRRLLVDGDVAQNVGNWQWVAGTGADAAPYFRVFNPVSQSKKFDPGGDYIRRYVPELRGLGGGQIHAPWEVPPLELAAAGVTLGVDYPAPIVDHHAARLRTLEVYGEAAG